MRIVFTSWAWTSHLYPMVPLAWAARLAGHEVLVAVPPALVPTALAAGLPAVAVGTDYDIAPVMRRFDEVRTPAGPGSVPLDPEIVAVQRRRRRGGPLNVFGLICDTMLDDLLALCRRWAPDVVVHDPTSYAGPLVAAAIGVPAVRHIWGVDFQATVREYEPDLLEPFCERLGLAGCDTRGALTVDPCPQRLQIDSDDVRFPVRYVPYNGASAQPRWLRDAPGDRPRVCVSWGTTSGTFGGDGGLRAILAAVAELDVEVVAALSARDTQALGPVASGVRVGPVPLHMLVPTCALVLNQGGAGTVMTTVAAGVPQLIAPRLPDQILNADRVAGCGAGAHLDTTGADSVRDAVSRAVASADMARAAHDLGADSAAQHPVAEAVTALAGLAALAGAA